MIKNKLDQSQNRLEWNMDSTHLYFIASVCKDEPYKRPCNTPT
ncbi:hypothetical protein BH11BAC5_BH11BAC5_05300 [soil metagenome]